MPNKILMTYATRYGSTQEVAEKVAAMLRENGLTVFLQPMREVQSLDGYQAVILGAPLYIGRLHKDARRFLAHHQAALTQLPVALFALGPISTDEAEMVGSRQQLNHELEKYPWLKPVAVETFVGKFDPDKLNFLHKLLVVLPVSPLRGMGVQDHRNWDAIRAWTTNLPAKLGQ